MSAATSQKVKNTYQVIEVKKIATPDGMPKGNWHSYTIERGSSVITGKKPGTLKAVTAHAKQFALDLNERMGMNNAGSLYAARRKT